MEFYGWIVKYTRLLELIKVFYYFLVHHTRYSLSSFIVVIIPHLRKLKHSQAQTVHSFMISSNSAPRQRKVVYIFTRSICRNSLPNHK